MNNLNLLFNSTELQRYSRHIVLSEIGATGQQRIKAARVLCIGAGGLGSPALLYLAAAGVGTLGIADNDCVDLSNLQRQVIFSTNDVKKEKAKTAQKCLKALNPEINLIAHTIRITADNALQIINDYDIIVDGTDNFKSRYLINDACYHLKKPTVYASVLHFSAQCSVFNMNNGPCYRCLYPAAPPPELIPNCAEAGVLGVLPGIMGSIQATETLKLILGIGKSLNGRLLVFDALNMNFEEYNIPKNPDCQLCGQQRSFSTLANEDITMSCQTVKSITVQELKAMKDNNAPFLLLDVREPFEYSICNLGGKLIPLGQLPEKLHELTKEKMIVIHCRSGGRSQQAAQLLQAHGFQVKNLSGGILAWIHEIDSSLASY